MKRYLSLILIAAFAASTLAQSNITDWRTVAAETNNPMSLRLDCAKLIAASPNKTASDNGLLLNVVQDASDSGTYVLTDKRLIGVMNLLLSNRPSGYYRIAINAVRDETNDPDYRAISSEILLRNPNRDTNDVSAVLNFVEKGLILEREYPTLVGFVSTNYPASYNRMLLSIVRDNKATTVDRISSAKVLSETSSEYATNDAVIRVLNDKQEVRAKRYANKKDNETEEMRDIRFKRAYQSRSFLSDFCSQESIANTQFASQQALAKSLLDSGKRDEAKQVLLECRTNNPVLLDRIIVNFFNIRRFKQKM